MSSLADMYGRERMENSAEATRYKVLIYLVRTRLQGEIAPTIREIGRAVGLKSPNSVHRHLGRLEAEGFVRSVKGKLRTVSVTDKGMQAIGEMPVKGRIAAGRGLEAIAADDEFYSLFSNLLFSNSGRDRYVLRVVGDSMIEGHIADGDLLVVEENEDPEDGSVVVALLEEGDEVTVKRIYRDGKAVRLVPMNPRYREIVVGAESVVIQGEVVSVIHPPRL